MAATRFKQTARSKRRERKLAGDNPIQIYRNCIRYKLTGGH